jgi:hypothetical protein
MRINGPGGAGPAATTQVAARRAAPAGGFAVAAQEAAAGSGTPTALRTVGGIDALLALQGIEDPITRRKTAVKRGRMALDALDELKLGLLGGTLEPATMVKLKAAAAFLQDGTGDIGLDAVLADIELRAEVEIAKMAAAARPADYPSGGTG